MLAHIRAQTGRNPFYRGLIVIVSCATAGCGLDLTRTRTQATEQSYTPPDPPDGEGGIVESVDEDPAMVSAPVTPSGAFSHSIPFELPAATPGIAPQLGLTYSSTGGVGQGGVGWNFSMRAITLNAREGARPREQAEDIGRYGHERAPARYTSDLGDIAVSAEAGLAFVRDNGLTIVNGPDRSGSVEHNGDVAAFHVHSKDGTRHRYGYHDDASLVMDAFSAVDKKTAWYLDEVLDAHGNKAEYYYEGAHDSRHLSSPTQQPRLRAVRYGQMGAVGPQPVGRYYVALLDYKESGFAPLSFFNGTRIDGGMVLDRMCVYANANLRWEDPISRDPGTLPADRDMHAGPLNPGPHGWGLDQTAVNERLWCYELDYDFENTDPADDSYTGRPLLVAVRRTNDVYAATPNTEWRFEYNNQGGTWKETLHVALASDTHEPYTLKTENTNELYRHSLATSERGPVQQVTDINGDGVPDDVWGTADGTMGVMLGKAGPALTAAEIEEATEEWNHPLADQTPATLAHTDADNPNDLPDISSKSNCWNTLRSSVEWETEADGLAYAETLTAGPTNFQNIYEDAFATTDDEFERGFKTLGAMQWLANDTYGPYPRVGRRNIIDKARRIEELEVFGAKKDTRMGESAFDWRTSDCQLTGGKREIDHCWEVTESATETALGELGCLDNAESRWFTLQSTQHDFPEITAYSSGLWGLLDLNGNGLIEWVFGSPVIKRDATGGFRDTAKKPDWFMAESNGTGFAAIDRWPTEGVYGEQDQYVLRGSGFLHTTTSTNWAARANPRFGMNMCLGWGRQAVTVSPRLDGAFAATYQAAQIGAQLYQNPSSVGNVVGQGMLTAANAAIIPMGGSGAPQVNACIGFDVGLDGSVRGDISAPVIGKIASFGVELSEGTNEQRHGLIDIDGDGRLDRVFALYENDATETANQRDRWAIQRNNGNGFDRAYTMRFWSGLAPQGNGPTAADGSRSYRSISRSETRSYRAIEPFPSLLPYGYGVNEREAGFVDINGDGLQDFVDSTQGSSAGPPSWRVYFNEGGREFSQAIYWDFEESHNTTGCTRHVADETAIPALAVDVFHTDRGDDGFTRRAAGLFDANGDGLLDYVYVQMVQWTNDHCGWIPPGKGESAVSDWTEVVSPRQLNGPVMVMLNNGRGFDEAEQWLTSASGVTFGGGEIHNPSTTNQDEPSPTRTFTDVGVGDFNGDGTPDVAVYEDTTDTTNFKLYKLREPLADVLKTVHHPTGGRTDVEYTFKEGTTEMGPGRWLPTTITKTDIDDVRTTDESGESTSEVSTTHYHFGSAVFDREEREFRGYGAITSEKDGGDGYTITRYYQEPGLEGIPFCQQVNRWADPSNPGSAAAAADQYLPLPRWTTSNKPALPSPTLPPDLADLPDLDTAAEVEDAAGTDQYSDPQDEYTGVDESITYLGETPEHPIEPTLDQPPSDSVHFVDQSPTTCRVSQPVVTMPTPDSYDRFDVFEPVVGELPDCAPVDASIPVSRIDHLHAEYSPEPDLYSTRMFEWRQTSFNHDGTESRTTSAQRSFNEDGLLEKSVANGDLNDPADDVSTEITYRPRGVLATATWGIPCRVEQRDAEGRLLSLERTGHDGAPATDCSTGAGDTTITEQRVAQELIGDTPSVEQVATYTYGPLGLVTSQTKAGATTTFRYHQTIPWLLEDTETTVSSLTAAPDPHDPASYSTVATTLISTNEYYEDGPRFGLIKKATDINGTPTMLSYDRHRRLTSTDSSDAGGGIETIRELVYLDGQSPTGVTTRSRLEGNSWTETTTTVDGFGREYRTVATAAQNLGGHAQVVVSESRFDSFGRVTRQLLPHYVGQTPNSAMVVDTTYDAAGRVTTLLWPNGGQTTNTYSHVGVTAQDPLGNVTYRETDAFGRDAQTVEYDEEGGIYRQTERRYTALGHLREMVDGNQESGAVWTWEHDALGNVLKVEDPDSGIRHNAYDADGRLTHTHYGTGPAGTLGTHGIEFSYDEVGRVTRIAEFRDPSFDAAGAFDGELVELSLYYYDSVPTTLSGAAATCSSSAAKGRLSRTEQYHQCAPGECGLGEEVALHSRHELCYDARGRLAETTDNIEGTIYQTAFTHRTDGSVATVTYPDGDVVTNTYDDSGSLVSATSSVLGALVSNAYYNVQGLLVVVEQGGAVTTEKCYGLGTGSGLALRRSVAHNGAVGSLTCGPVGGGAGSDSLSGAATAFHDVEYERNDNAHPVVKTEAYTDPHTSAVVEHVSSYTYDPFGRLKQEVYDGVARDFEYDRQDNLIAKDGLVLCYGEDSRPECTHTPDVGPHQLSGSATGDEFAYDEAGRTRSWANPAALFGYSYDYSPAGRLLSFTSASGQNTYRRNASGTLVAKSGLESAHYSGAYQVRDPAGGAVVRLHYGPWAMKSAGVLHYRVEGVDSSSAVLISAASGDATQVVTYEPFGAPRDQVVNGAAPTDRLFSDKERQDAGYQTDHHVFDFGPRLYLANYGRWLAPDDSFVDGPNLYAYVRNNPIVYADPSGRSAEPLILDRLGLDQMTQPQVEAHLMIVENRIKAMRVEIDRKTRLRAELTKTAFEAELSQLNRDVALLDRHRQGVREIFSSKFVFADARYDIRLRELHQVGVRDGQAGARLLKGMPRPTTQIGFRRRGLWGLFFGGAVAAGTLVAPQDSQAATILGEVDNVSVEVDGAMDPLFQGYLAARRLPGSCIDCEPVYRAGTKSYREFDASYYEPLLQYFRDAPSYAGPLPPP